MNDYQKRTLRELLKEKLTPAGTALDSLDTQSYTISSDNVALLLKKRSIKALHKALGFNEIQAELTEEGRPEAEAGAVQNAYLIQACITGLFHAEPDFDIADIDEKMTALGITARDGALYFSHEALQCIGIEIPIILGDERVGLTALPEETVSFEGRDDEGMTEWLTKSADQINAALDATYEQHWFASGLEGWLVIESEESITEMYDACLAQLRETGAMHDALDALEEVASEKGKRTGLAMLLAASEGGTIDQIRVFKDAPESMLIPTHFSPQPSHLPHQKGVDAESASVETLMSAESRAGGVGF